ncbi:hypothetical protein [Streptomyces sp. UNOB3_S3]|uniref:hypothetical protein n=1 Tax=Streptomyces sp. UNOB3_S3 TaxID=2871682 RepID=UPI001E60C924|nr:hypothetical protein [Streptomyces sp. UNOB3_S3]MCC3773293.1 hypothetical protein [Streptomyces sp. UNOB3_S3]
MRASIVHDISGRVVSVARPAKDAKVKVLSGPGQSVLEIDIEEDAIHELINGKLRIDTERKKVVSYDQ